MKLTMIRVLSVAAVLGVVAVAGCSKTSEPEASPAAEVGERSGAAVDTAAETTAEAAGVVVDKTGEALEKAGSAVEGAGADMRE